MKTLKKIIALLVVMIYFSSCDYVTVPLKPRTIVTSGDTNKVYKNILVEDYTGSTCVNCPFAAEELDTLISIYGSRIIPMSVNAGNFATPVPTYSLNLQSPVGDAYDAFFNMSGTGNPCGMINRKGNPLNAKYLLWGQWGASVQNIIQNDTAFIKLTLSTTFDTTSRVLSVTATSTFLKSLSGTYNLVVLFTQDNIIGPQKKSGTAGISNYVHRFVLKDALTSTWGDALVTAGSNTNQVITKTYSYNVAATYPTAAMATNNPGNKPPTICDFRQCSIVAYIYDATSNGPTQYEVLQAEQKKIYP
ncbi:MAG: Omp28-related outer membrane protein [Bacteroidia bacterium]